MLLQHNHQVPELGGASEARKGESHHTQRSNHVERSVGLNLTRVLKPAPGEGLIVGNGGL